MKYAVVRIAGHQYKISEGDVFEVDRTDKIEPEVLMAVDGEKVEIGTPLVKNAKVSLAKIDDVKGEKIKVFKYRAKSRYRKTIGFRPQLTRLEVKKITI